MTPGWFLVMMGVLLGWPAGSYAQMPAGFDKASVAWRTALHFDPGAESTLKSLVDLYQKAGRLAELAGLYEQHVLQYPTDENARVVFVRLLVLTEDRRAEAVLRAALERFPQSALLKHTEYEILAKAHDPGAVAALDKAVALETKFPARRTQWLGELIKSAAGAGRDDLLAARMHELGKGAGLSSPEAVMWVRRCLDAGLKQSADAASKSVQLSDLGAEDLVEARFVLARCALLNERRSEAAEHAAELRELLAPDHWRWKEAQLLFWQSAEERQREESLSGLESRWKAAPGNEVSALAYGDVLVLAGRREVALKVWQKSLTEVPESKMLEERVIALLQEGGQEVGLLDFMNRRLQSNPGRMELRLQKARLLLQLGRVEEGRRELAGVVAGQSAVQQVEIRLQTARWLRQQNLFNEASGILEDILAGSPQRWDVRKELAELRILLRRADEVNGLFDLEPAVEVPDEVRLEVAQFLVSRKFWAPARRLLEAWVRQKPGAFEVRLLLARLESVTGDGPAAGRLLEECRRLCDTDARYSSWLEAAWELAAALDEKGLFVEEERKRLWPAPGVSWPVENLRRLGLLAEKAAQDAPLQQEVEKLLRAALADGTAPGEVKNEFRQLLIRVLDRSGAASRAMEEEIEKALETAVPETCGDLQLRLGLIYMEAGRVDLARVVFEKLLPGQCQDAALIQKSLAALRELGRARVACRMAERLVRLQPDEKAHWTTWTGLLLETEDESALRLALREMDAKSSVWKLSGETRGMIRQHLAASAWRTVSAVLADPGKEVHEALLCLADLEQAEERPQARLWIVWARGLLARLTGDQEVVAEVRSLLSGKEPWIALPDGLSLSVEEARRMLAEPRVPQERAEVVRSGDYTREGGMAWRFSGFRQAGLLGWCLTPDGSKVLVQDVHARFYALDRVSGKLLWQVRLSSGAAAAAPAGAPMAEQLVQPLEWCLDDGHACILHETGLVCLELSHGGLAWKLPVSARSGGMQGALARQGSRVLLWNAALAVLDSRDMTTGKLLWSREIPGLGRRQPVNQGNPVWLMSGIQVDGGRALVWGNGTAVVNGADGSVLWTASAGPTAPSLPIPMDATPVSPASAGYVSGGSLRSGGRGLVSPALLTSALSVPAFGYPGMFGGAMSSPWLLWGGDGDRWLQGDGVWLLGQNLVSARYSVLGFPQGDARVNSPYYMNSFAALGTVGGALIAHGERGLAKIMPDGRVIMLGTHSVRDNSPSRHPLPAAGMEGSQVGLAGHEGLRVFDGLSGTVVLSHLWLADEKALLAPARDGLRAWNSLRWSSRGLAFYDGRGMTQMMDWRLLMRDGDVVFPVGTSSLFCYRCGSGAQASSPPVQGQRRVTNDQAR